jgi:hypothetical protein
MRRLGFALGLMAALLAWTCSAMGAEPEVRVQQLTGGGFRLTVTVPGSSDVPNEAQAALAPTVLRLCGREPANLGHYSFNAAKPLTGGIGTLTLVQDLTCGVPSPKAAPLAAAGAMVAEEAIPALTDRFFAFLRRADYRAAYDLSGVEAASGQSYEAWAQAEQAFVDSAGAAQRFEIRKVTRYLNPANAPRPGLYIAVDYTAQRSKSAFECGYLIWFRADEHQPFRITRQERGALPKDLLLKLDDAQLAKLRQQLRCV